MATQPHATDGRSTRADAEERRQLLHYREHRDARTRAQLIERYLPLARHLARRYKRPNEPIDDLVQVASMALVTSLDRFDPSLGNRFSSFAVPSIIGALKRHFRDSGWDLHVPRTMQDRVRELEAAARRLEDRLGRSPSTSELAEKLRLSLEEVHETKRAACAYSTVSLDAHADRSPDRGEPVSAYALETEEKHYELVEYGAAIAQTVETLDGKDRLILHLRFIDDLTLVQIAKRVGTSEMQVSRSVRRMRDQLRAVV